jgi:hypothetical protein
MWWLKKIENNQAWKGNNFVEFPGEENPAVTGNCL